MRQGGDEGPPTAVGAAVVNPGANIETLDQVAQAVGGKSLGGSGGHKQRSFHVGGPNGGGVPRQRILELLGQHHGSGLVALGLGGTEVDFSLQGAVSVDQVFDPQGGNLTHPHPSPMHQVQHGLVAQGVAGASKTPVKALELVWGDGLGLGHMVNLGWV